MHFSKEGRFPKESDKLLSFATKKSERVSEAIIGPKGADSVCSGLKLSALIRDFCLKEEFSSKDISDFFEKLDKLSFSGRIKPPDEMSFALLKKVTALLDSLHSRAFGGDLGASDCMVALYAYLGLTSHFTEISIERETLFGFLSSRKILDCYDDLLPSYILLKSLVGAIVRDESEIPNERYRLWVRLLNSDSPACTKSAVLSMFSAETFCEKEILLPKSMLLRLSSEPEIVQFELAKYIGAKKRADCFSILENMLISSPGERVLATCQSAMEKINPVRAQQFSICPSEPSKVLVAQKFAPKPKFGPVFPSIKIPGSSNKAFKCNLN